MKVSISCENHFTQAPHPPVWESSSSDFSIYLYSNTWVFISLISPSPPPIFPKSKPLARERGNRERTSAKMISVRGIHVICPRSWRRSWYRHGRTTEGARQVSAPKPTFETFLAQHVITRKPNCVLLRLRGSFSGCCCCCCGGMVFVSADWTCLVVIRKGAGFDPG